MDQTELAEPVVAAEVLMRKVIRRIIPFIFVCYVVSYLDRINVGFAALQMNKDIGLTPSQFGFGAGLFFIGYFVCEIPSNLALQRFGGRRWIARIMITWGRDAHSRDQRSLRLFAGAAAARYGGGGLYAGRLPVLHLLVPWSLARPGDGGVPGR